MSMVSLILVTCGTKSTPKSNYFYHEGKLGSLLYLLYDKPTPDPNDINDQKGALQNDQAVITHHGARDRPA